MEQITRLLFIRRLDELQMVDERKAMSATVGERVFPFLREPGGDASTYEQEMRDARFTAPTPALPARVVEQRVHSEQRRIQRDPSSSALPCGTTSW